ncbi:MAG: hypothetical protein H6906_10055 [Hyphomicrobiales bacterium]|nr:hypothetical protein [Hyphomicrobiales bacterium]
MAAALACGLAGALAGTPAAHAQGGPVADVVGLKPGLTYDEVVALLRARDDVSGVETAVQWIRQSNGQPTRQLVRGADGTPCAAGEKPLRRGFEVLCNSYGGRFEARRDIGNEIVVAFTGMPGQEKAGIIWRHTVFPDGEAPTVAALEKALAEKYGTPHMRQTEAGYYSTTHRLGAVNLNWIHAPTGARITQPDSLKARCVNGPKPWFAAKHEWNGACGLTVRAEILPQPANRLLAHALNVSVLHQRDLLTHLRLFDAALKSAVEKKSGGKAKKVDL